jgi:hypothetical protein
LSTATLACYKYLPVNKAISKHESKATQLLTLSLGLKSETATLSQISRTSTKLRSIVKFQMKLIEAHAI